MSKIFVILLLAMLMPFASGQWAIAPKPTTEDIDIITDSGGNASIESHLLTGELLVIQYLNGNFTAEGNVTLENENGILIDLYNLSSGNVYRAPGLQYLGSADAWRPYVLSSTMWLNMSGQQANKTATVQLIYR